jgi:hypothetical protein
MREELKLLLVAAGIPFQETSLYVCTADWHVIFRPDGPSFVGYSGFGIPKYPSSAAQCLELILEELAICAQK